MAQDGLTFAASCIILTPVSDGERAVEIGGMAEWTMAAVLKTVVAVRSPGVRIPLPPLFRSGEVPERSNGAAC